MVLAHGLLAAARNLWTEQDLIDAIVYVLEGRGALIFSCVAFWPGVIRAPILHCLLVPPDPVADAPGSDTREPRVTTDVH